jgi:hypothetical protein
MGDRATRFRGTALEWAQCASFLCSLAGSPGTDIRGGGGRARRPAPFPGRSLPPWEGTQPALSLDSVPTNFVRIEQRATGFPEAGEEQNPFPDAGLMLQDRWRTG